MIYQWQLEWEKAFSQKNFFECWSAPNRQKLTNLIKWSALAMEVTQEKGGTFKWGGTVYQAMGNMDPPFFFLDIAECWSCKEWKTSCDIAVPNKVSTTQKRTYNSSRHVLLDNLWANMSCLKPRRVGSLLHSYKRNTSEVTLLHDQVKPKYKRMKLPNNSCFLRTD